VGSMLKVLQCKRFLASHQLKLSVNHLRTTFVLLCICWFVIKCILKHVCLQWNSVGTCGSVSCGSEQVQLLVKDYVSYNAENLSV
jgi:hypothetical protein